MSQEIPTWAADGLAVYRSVTPVVTKNHHRSRIFFVRYLLSGRRDVRGNYLG